MLTFLAALDMSPELGSSANLDRLHHAPLTNPRPPNRPAATRGAGELAGRPGRTGRFEK